MTRQKHVTPRAKGSFEKCCLPGCENPARRGGICHMHDGNARREPRHRAAYDAAARQELLDTRTVVAAPILRAVMPHVEKYAEEQRLSIEEAVAEMCARFVMGQEKLPDRDAQCVAEAWRRVYRGGDVYVEGGW